MFCVAFKIHLPGFFAMFPSLSFSFLVYFSMKRKKIQIHSQNEFSMSWPEGETAVYRNMMWSFEAHSFNDRENDAELKSLKMMRSIIIRLLKQSKMLLFYIINFSFSITSSIQGIRALISSPSLQFRNVEQVWGKVRISLVYVGFMLSNFLCILLLLRKSHKL